MSPRKRTRAREEPVTYLRKVPRPPCHPTAQIWLVQNNDGALGFTCGTCHRVVGQLQLEERPRVVPPAFTEVTAGDLREPLREAERERERRRAIRQERTRYRDVLRAQGEAIATLRDALETVTRRHDELIALLRSEPTSSPTVVTAAAAAAAPPASR